MFYKFRKIYLCLVVVYAIIREIVPLNFLISSTYVSLSVLLLGVVLVIWDLCCDKNVLKTKNVVWLFAFIGIYFLSMLINVKYGIFGNIKTLGILFVFFFTLYAYGKTRSREEYEKDLISVFIAYNITIGIFLFIGVLMYVFDIGYTVAYFDASSQGFVREYSRLWGMFTEANCAAVYSLVALVTSVWLYCKTDRIVNRILLCINIFNGYLFMVLTLSNTAKLVFLISAVWITFYITWFKVGIKSVFKKTMVVITVSFISLALLFGVVKGTEKVLPYAKHIVQIAPGYKTVQEGLHKASDYLYVNIGSIPVKDGLLPKEELEEPIVEINSPPEILVLDRVDEDLADISHGRMDRWRASINIFKMSPIIGVTARNVNTFAAVNNPSNILAKYGLNVHNSYLEVLVSTGVIGMLVFVIFFVLSIIIVFRVVYYKYSLSNILLSSAIILVSLAGFFHTDLFFIFRLGGVILWTTLGYFALQASGLDKKEN